MLSALLSPDAEHFSTAPSTPNQPVEIQIRPSLSRKTSRPSNLQFDSGDWDTGIVVDRQPSPGVTTIVSGSEIDVTITNGTSVSLLTQRPSPRMHPTKSPCFVHSHLDKGASLSDWLRSKQRPDQPALLNGNSISKPRPAQLSQDRLNDEAEEEEEHTSLTAQLAETAVGVREMSKQLGV